MKEIIHIANQPINFGDSYLLLIEYNNNYFNYAVFDEGLNTIIRFGFFEQDQNIRPALLENIFEELKLNQIKFATVKVKHATTEFVFIPNQFYNPSEQKDVLMNTRGVFGEANIYADKVVSQNLFTVYGSSIQNDNFLKQKFGKYFSCHLFSDAFKQSLPTEHSDMIWMDMKQNEFAIMVKKNNQFQLGNIFYFNQPNDVQQILLNIAQQFSFNTSEVRFSLQGLIDEQDETFRMIVAHFQNLYFISNDQILIHPELNNLPPHYFTSLSNLALCEL